MQDLLNKIHLGDSLELMKKIPDDSIDLIVTDPPYIVDTTAPTVENYIGATKKHSKMNDAKYWDEKNFEGVRYTLEDIKNGFDIDTYLNEFDRISKKFNAFIFCSNKQISSLMTWGEEKGYITTLLVWYKTNATPFANGVWRSNLEFIVHIRESGATFNGDVREKSKIYISPTEVSKYGHPTEKPIDLVKKLIRIGSNEGDIVADFFVGSGTTVNGCIDLKRQYIAGEIKPEYYKTACEREQRALGNFGLFKDLL